jgi:hypothetical protein
MTNQEKRVRIKCLLAYQEGFRDGKVSTPKGIMFNGLKPSQWYTRFTKNILMITKPKSR